MAFLKLSKTQWVNTDLITTIQDLDDDALRTMLREDDAYEPYTIVHVGDQMLELSGSERDALLRWLSKAEDVTAAVKANAPTEPKFKVGDRVKANAPRSLFNGMTGTVIEVDLEDEDNKPYLVQSDKAGTNGRFAKSRYTEYELTPAPAETPAPAPQKFQRKQRVSFNGKSGVINGETNFNGAQQYQIVFDGGEIAWVWEPLISAETPAPDTEHYGEKVHLLPVTAEQVAALQMLSKWVNEWGGSDFFDFTDFLEGIPSIYVKDTVRTIASILPKEQAA